MAISFIDSAVTHVTAATTSVSVNLPSTSAATDDLMILCYFSGVSTSAVSALSGWTQVEAVGTGSGSGMEIWYKFYNGDGSTVSMTLGSSMASVEITVGLYRGVDTTTPFVVELGQADDNVATPIVTNTDANAWGVAYLGAKTSSSTGSWSQFGVDSSAPGVWTKRIESPNGAASNGALVGMYDTNGTAATGDHTITSTPTPSTTRGGSWIGFLTPAAATGSSGDVSATLASLIAQLEATQGMGSVYMKHLSPQMPNGGIFDVVAYGADSTGTNDSQPAFQAAATAAQTYASSNKGAVLLIPPGQYKLNSTFRIIGGKVAIYAYGAYIFAGSNNDLFRDFTTQDSTYTLNGTGLQVLGGIWDCNGQVYGSSTGGTLDAAGYSAFTIACSSDILFRDVTIRNVYNYHGIDINTCDGVMVDGCRFEGFKNNFDWLTPVKVATTANIASLSGLISVNGYTVVAGDRVLVKNQTTASQNGIYVAASGAWTRATDMAAGSNGDRKAVRIPATGGESYKGTTYTGAGTTLTATSWYVSTANPTVNTTSMTWTQVANSFNTTDRYFSEAVQIDDGDNNIASKSITVNNCYMGPSQDGSGLGSFGKMAGTHTDTSGQLYLNIKFTNNTSVGSLSNAFQGYSYSDSIIANNVILGSEERGVRMFFNSLNSGPRLSITNNVITNTKLHGIEIDGGASQVFKDVLISGNTITSTVMNGGSNSTGIRVDTCDRVMISNNLINLASSPSRNQGIYLLSSTDSNVTGNNIVDVGTQGIQTTTNVRCNFTNNNIIRSGQEGIYLTASSVRCNFTGNNIIGAGAAANATYAAIRISNSANTLNSFTNNNVRKIGASPDTLIPVLVDGTSPSENYFVGNVFQGFSSTHASNFTLNSNTTVRTEIAAATTANSTRL